MSVKSKRRTNQLRKTFKCARGVFCLWPDGFATTFRDQYDKAIFQWHPYRPRIAPGL